MKKPCEESAHHDGEVDPSDAGPSCLATRTVPSRTSRVRLSGLRRAVVQRERRHGAVSVRAHLPQATGGLNIGTRDGQDRTTVLEHGPLTEGPA